MKKSKTPFRRLALSLNHPNISSTHQLSTQRNNRYFSNIKDPSFYHFNNINNEIKSLQSLKTLTSFLNNSKSENLEDFLIPKDTSPTNFTYNGTYTHTYQDTLPSVVIPQSKTHYIEINKFDYKRIFKPKGLFRRRPCRMDNRINLQYADTSEEFDKKAIEQNQLQKMYNPYVTNKIKELQGKIKFVKGIIDFSYPSVVVKKIKEIDKTMKLKAHNVRIYNPCEQRVLTQKIRNNQRKFFLTQTMRFNCLNEES
jgi:hypothetical protein